MRQFELLYRLFIETAGGRNAKRSQVKAENLNVSLKFQTDPLPGIGLTIAAVVGYTVAANHIPIPEQQHG